MLGHLHSLHRLPSGKRADGQSFGFRIGNPLRFEVMTVEKNWDGEFRLTQLECEKRVCSDEFAYEREIS